MRQSMKRIAIPALAAMTAFAMCLPAYAATRDKVSSVKLKVVCDEEPQAGEDVGSVTVSVTSPNTVTVSENAEYYDTNDDVWERGEIPVIRLELEVTDADKYYFTSSTKVSVSGFHSEVKSKKVLNGGDNLRVDIKLRKVSGDLDSVEDLYWNGRTAHWDEIDDADKYEVKLYRGSSTVTTVTTSSSSYNFYPYMTKSGDYTFKVRGISNSDGEKSEWSDESEEYYMNSNDVYTGTPPTNNGSSSSGSSHSGSGWAQDQFGWTYRYSDGNLAKGWIYVDNNWFYMAANGYMMTGWIFVDNNWFYLNPVSDGTRGAMKTGWQFIDNNWYYLNPVSDGTRGARMYGYQFIDGNWYVLDPVSGARWSNTTTAFGQWIDANGVVH